MLRIYTDMIVYQLETIIISKYQSSDASVPAEIALYLINTCQHVGNDTTNP